MRLSLVSMPTLRSASSGNRAGSHPHQSTTTMRRHTLPLLVGAVAALAVACRDSVVAPTRNLSDLSASASPLFSSSSANRDHALLGTIELSPEGGRYHVGDFDIVIPAGAICDPASTKYGPRHWDEDCVPARKAITVNVIAKRRHNQVSVDFQPDLRFRPSAGWVRIETNAYSDILTSDAVRHLSTQSPFFGSFALLYVPSGGAARVDEMLSTGDASMVTHVNLRTGIVWRRVKHFSGYMVSYGDKCAPTDQVTCVVDDGSGTVSPLTGATSIGVTIDLGFSIPSVVVDTTLTMPDTTTTSPDTTTTLP